MQVYRLYFSKTEDAKFISHLDLNRCFTRAIRRSGIDVWYTEGFNRHLYLLFALPLALGLESVADCVDIKLDDAFDARCLPEMINRFLPKGINIFDCVLPKHKHGEISAAKYIIELNDSRGSLLSFRKEAEKLISGDEILVEKPGKRGVRQTDIKKQIQEIGFVRDGENMLVKLTVDAGNDSNLNPALFINRVFDGLECHPDFYRIVRTGILVSNGENFE